MMYIYIYIYIYIYTHTRINLWHVAPPLQVKSPYQFWHAAPHAPRPKWGQNIEIGIHTGIHA